MSGQGLMLHRDEEFLQLVMVRVVCQLGWAMVPSYLIKDILNQLTLEVIILGNGDGSVPQLKCLRVKIKISW